MTTYELAKTLTPEQIEAFTKAGIVKSNVTRYIYIYELWIDLLSAGLSKMDAYYQIGQRCYTCEENVRKIICYMQNEW